MVDPHFGLVRISATKYAKLPASNTAEPTRNNTNTGSPAASHPNSNKPASAKTPADVGLTYDTRNHGESDTGTCEWVTCRNNERTGMDLAAVTFMGHVHALAA